MEIKTGEYNVWNECSTIHYEGTLRLSGTDAYQPILELMQQVLAEKPQNVVLDLTQLEFLNSSGINLLAKFTIELRKHPDMPVKVVGSSKIPWQSKSLPNLQKLHKGVELVIV